MKNKEIQEKRMKGYFIQATKNILKGEGIKGISVRNIADQAGYSYATLYNYFKDINDLVFVCINDFQEESKQFVANQTKKNDKGIDKLRASILAYVNYFIEYPGIFEIFYLTKVGDLGNKKEILNLISKSLDDICENEWNNCIKSKIFPLENIESLKSQLRYSIIGMLVLYLNRLTPMSYTEFINEVNGQLDYQLGIKEISNQSKNIQSETSKVQNSVTSININK